MKLLTKAILKKLPVRYDDSKSAEEIKVPLKLFNPSGVGTWYIIEYNPETEIAFGYCDLDFPELGYVSIKELKKLRFPPFGLGIERDMYWDSNTTLKQVMEGEVS